MEYYQQLGLKNLFTNKAGNKEINFRNETNARDSVSSIEIRGEVGKWTKDFEAKTEDNVAMALSLLGVGRVTEDVEQQAHVRANFALDENQPTTIDGLLKTAVINLRAILIAQEKQQEQEKNLAADAWGLYKLSHPKSSVTVEEFKENQFLQETWMVNLRNVRKDPTKLQAL